MKKTSEMSKRLTDIKVKLVINFHIMTKKLPFFLTKTLF